jgi:hypothetical protein
MSRTSARRTYDGFSLEHAIVETRNRLKFRLRPKDNPSAHKYFIIGHAKTGTNSFHYLFESAGLRSCHQSGFWDTAKYDCFSDRGNYQPIDLYKAYYPNAIFILNCRPLRAYLRSLAIHLNRDWYRHEFLSPQAFINHAYRRNDYFARVAQMFEGSKNFLVANIQKKGMFADVAQKLGLSIDQDEFHGKKTSLELETDLTKNLKEAIDRLDLGDKVDMPFIIPELLSDETRSKLGSIDHESCFL